jgi:hypothetical protein
MYLYIKSYLLLLSHHADPISGRAGNVKPMCVAFGGKTAIVDVFLKSITERDVIIGKIAFTYLPVGLQ